MGVSKVVYNSSEGETVLLDLTEDTVSADTLAEGVTAHDASGESVTGTMISGTPIINITSTDGITYTGTVNNLTELTKGYELVVIPDLASTQTTPKLNINGLGDKNIIMPIDGVNTVIGSNAATLANWLSANAPTRIMFDGTRWKADVRAVSAANIYGTVAIKKGGTGATTAETARANLGIVDVPAVTTDDDGKFMRVVSGAWAAVTVDSAEGASF